jgi:hypothetical protein
MVTKSDVTISIKDGLTLAVLLIYMLRGIVPLDPYSPEAQEVLGYVRDFYPMLRMMAELTKENEAAALVTISAIASQIAKERT